MDGGIEGLKDGWKAVLVLGCLSSSIFMTVFLFLWDSEAGSALDQIPE